MNKMRELQFLLRKIPKGKITTYSILAKKLKIHPRTAALLLSKNLQPKKYPCYKVVYSNGKLSGYTLGVKKKIKLLKNDKIEVINSKINLKKYLFVFK